MGRPRLPRASQRPDGGGPLIDWSSIFSFAICRRDSFRRGLLVHAHAEEALDNCAAPRLLHGALICDCAFLHEIDVLADRQRHLQVLLDEENGSATSSRIL